MVSKNEINGEKPVGIIVENQAAGSVSFPFAKGRLASVFFGESLL